MKLMIGGYAQGKLQYALRTYQLKEDAVWDGVLPDENEAQTDMVVINHFHQWVRQSLLKGENPEAQVQSCFLSVLEIIKKNEENLKWIVAMEKC